VFPRQLVKNGSCASSVGTEDVNPERAALETTFPRGFVVHPVQLLYVRLSVEKADVFRLSARVAAFSAALAGAVKSGLRSRVSV
jgi:hypothetical protein